MRQQCTSKWRKTAAGLMVVLLMGVLAFVLAPDEVRAQSGEAYSWQELQEQLNTVRNGTVLLRADCIASEGDTHLTVPKGSVITINLNGYTIDASAIKVDVHSTDPGVERGSGIVVSGSLGIMDTDADKKGTITGACGWSGAILVYGGSLSMSSGNITGNSGFCCAGGVTITNGGSFTMRGGSIEDNNGDYGGGVLVSDGSFEMTKGTIAENSANFANEVYLEKGSITMSGGEIGSEDSFVGGRTPNVLINASANSAAMFEISGGSIAGCGTERGNVIIYSGAFTISGNPSISNNLGADIYLAKGLRINVADTLDDAFSMSVYTEEEPAEGSPVTITEGLKGKGSILAFSSDKGYGVGESDTGEAVFGVPTADITFQAGRGSGRDVTKKGITGYTFVLPNCMFTPPEGMKFVGWLTQEETTYQPGDKLKPVSSISFTAQYDCIEHKWSEPKYEWSKSNTSVTATRTCSVGGEKETETVSATSEVTTEPTCLVEGVRTWTSKAFKNTAFRVQTKEESIPLLEHKWSEPKYEWSKSNTSVTATRTCSVGGEKETETVSATSEVTTEPTCLVEGVRTWTSKVFKNTAFSVQTKEETIPRLEHKWSEPKYEWTEDNSFVTATRTCQIGKEEETETVFTILDVIEPTCEDAGSKTWISDEFINSAFRAQSKREKLDPIGHDWGAWKVTKKANALTKGLKQRVCAHDPSHVEQQVIPATGVSGTLMVRETTSGSKALKISWTKIKGAEGYDIFFARCNTNEKKIPCKKVKTVKGNKTFKWTKTGLKKKTAYKVYVKAFAAKDGKKTYIRTSPTMHAFTTGYDKKYTNAKAVTLKKTAVTIKKGKTYKIKANVTKLKSKKILMAKDHAPKLRYLSSDKKIATVSGAGKITAKAKGTCTIYIYAHSGISKSIKVKVK